jgi:IclR family acetate operon transcriptional repressor
MTVTTTRTAPPSGTEAAGRVADVLLAFLDGPTVHGVTALARELDLSKAVVHRILRTLVERGLVVPASPGSGYRLGPAAAALGARALRESDLRTVALPVLRRLQAATGETTTVSALVPGARVYLDQVVGRSEISMTVEVGRRFPLHAGSSSTAILAFLPEQAQEAVVRGRLERLTDLTVSDPDALRARLAEVRRDGHAHSDGERQRGAGSVAAPVFGVDGTVVGAISVCGPVDRVDDAARARFVPLLTEAADDISRALGWRGGLPGERA